MRRTAALGRTNRHLRGAVNERLPTPLYHQIYLILRDKIASGVYRRDDRLPGEQELVEMFGVSRITARRALDELAAEGLVVRDRGRGTRVRREPSLPQVRSSVEGLLENLLAMGLETRVRLLAFDYVAPPPDVARAMGLERGEAMLRAVRVRLLEDGPFSHLTTYVPRAIGDGISREDLASTPLLALLERAGVVVSRADQAITATLADAETAPLLEVEVGSPLLKIVRVVFDQAGRPVEHITGLYRPDRYQYRMSLDRVSEADARKWAPSADASPRAGSDVGDNGPRERQQR